MQFLNPNMLWALFFALIPLIIHLFNFRRYKTVYFSNVSLLTSINKETKKQSQLKNILLLIVRTLAIIFLVLAFARPYIPNSNTTSQQKQSVVAIYIDNSFSMEAVGKYGILLEQAKMKAIEIAKAYPPQTHFLLTTNNFTPKHSHIIGQKQFTQWVSQIRSTHIIRDLQQIQEAQLNIIQKDSSVQIKQYLISDFQSNIFNKEFYINNKQIQTTLVPVNSQQTDNVYIDSVWFSSPGHFIGKKEVLNVKISNYSDNDINNLQVNLFINDSLKAMVNVNIVANENKICNINFIQNKKGINTARIEISDYPITFDNTMFFSYLIANQIDIVELSYAKQYSYMEALFSNDDNYNYHKYHLSDIDYNKLSKAKVIILNEAEELSSGLLTQIEQTVKQGATLILIPPKQAHLNVYNNLLQQFSNTKLLQWTDEKGYMQDFNANSQYFKNSVQPSKEKIRLASYNGFYKILQSRKSQTEVLFSSESGQPLIIKESADKGNIILATLPLSDNSISDFSTHPIFVPLFYNIAMFSVHFHNIYHTLDAYNYIISNKIALTSDITITDKNRTFEFIPDMIKSGEQTKFIIHNQNIDAGNFFLNEEEKIKDVFSLNYNRKESQTSTINNKELRKYAKKSALKNVNILSDNEDNITEYIKLNTDTDSKVKLFLWLLFAMLIAEIIISKLMD